MQYEKFVWQYHSLPYIDSYFHQKQDSLPYITASWILKDYEQISRFFNYHHKRKIPLIVMGSPTLFEQTNVTQGIIPEGVGGFTESMKNRIVIPFSGDYQEFRHVLHHELVHAFQFGVLFENTSQALMRGGSAQLPLWFAEGLAEFLSSGWDKGADMFLMDQVIHNEVSPPGPALGGYMSYKGGQSFFYYLWVLRGEEKFMTMLNKFRISKKAVLSIEEAYDESIEELGIKWIQQLKQIYWPEMGHRLEADYNSIALTDNIKQRTFVNIKPKITPNGDKIAFYSDLKDNTGIVIIDSTGKKQQFISQFGNGSFFESFQPFRSGFTFSPDGEKIAFITKSSGKNDIRIKNITSGKFEKKISPPNLKAISSLDWSNSGKLLLFTGLSTDRGDLYTFNLETDQLVQLTNSITYEKDAQFSPTGEHIIFSAADTSNRIDSFPYQMSSQSDLYILSLKNNNITQITDTKWNEKQAVFSPNGEQIAFISDQNGIDNIYIMKLNSTENPTCITNYIGSCSYPDWSENSNEIVFTFFQKQAWNIRKIKDPLKVKPDSLPKPTTWAKHISNSTFKYYNPKKNKVQKKKKDKKKEITIKEELPIESTVGKKPDLIKETSISEELPDSTETLPDSTETLPDSTETLPDSTETLPNSTETLPNSTETLPNSTETLPNSTETLPNSTETLQDSTDTLSGSVDTSKVKLPKYAVKINFNRDTLKTQKYKLKFQPDAMILGLAFNSMYGYGGQGAISFSDLMGNHQMAIAANIQGNLNETGIFLSYFNTKYRTDFGGAFFLDRYYTYSDYDLDLLEHRTVIGFNALLRFPMSIFQRIDLSLLFKQMTDNPQKIEKNNIVEDPDREEYESKILIPSISHVYDNILWGLTGPARGVRTKTSILFQPPFKETEAAFISVDADLRHYLHIGKKFVWANRLAFGFSEPLGNKEVERKFFLGGNNFWLFYYLNLDSYKENYNNSAYSSHILPFRGWDYFDIAGTRFTVLNTEFRFPFVKELNIAWPLPLSIKYINGALFADIGNAWEPEDEINNLPLPDKLYGGIGMGLRINLGIFVLRYDAAWKTDWSNYLKGTRHYWSLGAEF